MVTKTSLKPSSAFIPFACSLVDASGAVLRRYFQKGSKALKARYKKAASPIVTLADREAEQALRKLIEKKFPDHGIIGEEFGVKKSRSPYTWVLDPLDGTIAFSMGKPLFGTLIALLKDGKPVLGVIDQPILQQRWLGVEGQALRFWKNRKLQRNAKTSPVRDLRQAKLATTTPGMFRSSKDRKAFDRVAGAVHVTSFGGDCMNYALLAGGWIDVVIEQGLNLYDFAALAPVIEAAGGVITDWKGQSLHVHSRGDVVASATPSLHKKVLKKLPR